MKKIISFIMTLFIVLIISVNGVSAAPSTRVIDGAGLLSSEEKATLESTISSIKEKYKFDVVIVTTKDLGGKTPEVYADDYYDKGKYGIGNNKDGILFLLSPKTRDYHISTCGFGISAFSDAKISIMGESVVAMLKDNNYYGAFKVFLKDVDRYVSLAKNPPPKPAEVVKGETDKVVKGETEPVVEDEPAERGTNVEIALGFTILFFPVSIIIALVIVFSMRRKHKTARPENLANNYVEDNGFELHINEDTFLHSNLSKTKIHKSPPSSGGSSGFGGGSSTHTSSSGQTHGGGGGKY